MTHHAAPNVQDTSPAFDAGPHALHCWRFANAEFDEARGELRIDGQPVAVEPRPLRVLAELLRHPDTVLTKEELLASVWQGRPTVEHVLPSAVNRLRRALGPQASVCIVTLPKQGYRFVGALQSSAAESPRATALPAAASAPGVSPEPALVAPLGSQMPAMTTHAAADAPPALVQVPVQMPVPAQHQPTMQGVEAPADLNRFPWPTAAAVLATLALLLVIVLAFMAGHAV